MASDPKPSLGRYLGFGDRGFGDFGLRVQLGLGSGCGGCWVWNRLQTGIRGLSPVHVELLTGRKPAGIRGGYPGKLPSPGMAFYSH